MSYILEALRKAEQERGLGRAPDLTTIHAVPAEKRRRVWLWLLVPALLVNAALLAVVAELPWRSEQAARQPPASPAPAAPGASAPEPIATPAATPETASILPRPDAATRGPAPLLHSLPAHFQRSVPDLSLDVHVYSEGAAKRFVLVNSRRYREGERLQEGPLLEAITLDGIVLSHDGKRFRIPVHR